MSTLTPTMPRPVTVPVFPALCPFRTVMATPRTPPLRPAPRPVPRPRPVRPGLVSCEVLPGKGTRRPVGGGVHKPVPGWGAPTPSPSKKRGGK